jgi:hypothetical protein
LNKYLVVVRKRIVRMLIVNKIDHSSRFFVHKTHSVQVNKVLPSGDYNSQTEELIPNYISVPNNCQMAIQDVINEMWIIFLNSLSIFFASAV